MSRVAKAGVTWVTIMLGNVLCGSEVVFEDTHRSFKLLNIYCYIYQCYACVFYFVLFPGPKLIITI